jgi:putative membrane protein
MPHDRRDMTDIGHARDAGPTQEHAQPPAYPVSAAELAAAAGDGWLRLSPRMLLIHPVQEVIRALPALVGVFLAGSRSGHGHGQLWGLVGLGVTVVLGLARWFTTTYRVTGEQVQVRRGLVNRQTVAVPRDRVRTVDLTSHAMHRALGLARVTVGTGRSDRKRADGGLRLDALDAAAAARLRADLLRRAPATATAAQAAEATAEVETELVRLAPAWVRYGPCTLSGLVTIGVLAAFASHVFNEAHIDPSRFGPLRALGDQLAAMPLWQAVAEVVTGLLVIAALASTVGYVLAFWGFRLARQAGGTLHVTRGLVTTRATTIEERRLHGVELSEPLLLRWAGGARLLTIATGLRVGRGAERGGTLLLPPAPSAVARSVATAVLRRDAPVSVPLTGHGARASRRRYSRALAGAVVVLGLTTLLTWVAGLSVWTPVAVAAFVLPAAVALAADRARSLGHALADRTLVTSFGSLARRRCMLSGEGIIGWNLRQSFFQRRAGLATLTATTAAGRQHYAVTDVELPTAVELADQALPGLLTPFLIQAFDAQPSEAIRAAT